jgi:excisionase family DNA binding protein
MCLIFLFLVFRGSTKFLWRVLLLCAILCSPVVGRSEDSKGRSIVVTKTKAATEHLAFLTPEEVSHMLRVSVYTVRRWIKEGSLPAYKVGRGWRISEPAMNEWLSENQSVVASHR